jgi:hypothetical protein
MGVSRELRVGCAASKFKDNITDQVQSTVTLPTMRASLSAEVRHSIPVGLLIRSPGYDQVSQGGHRTLAQRVRGGVAMPEGKRR